MNVRRLWLSADFGKLWLGQGISALGSSISDLALPTLAVLTLHAGPFEVGLLVALQKVPFPFVSLLAGVFVDRLPKRAVLIVCDLGRAAVLGAIPLAAVFGHLGLGLLYGAALAKGGLTVFFDLAYLSYGPILVGREDLSAANTRLDMNFVVGNVAGPGIAGLLVQAIGAARTVALDAASFLVSVLTLLIIRHKEPPSERQPGRSVRVELAAGLRYVLGNVILRAQFLTMTLVLFGASFFEGIIYPYAYRDLHLTPGELGLAFTFGGLAGFPGVWLGPRLVRAIGVGPALVIGFLAIPVEMFVFPLAGFLPAVPFLAGLLFFSTFFGAGADLNQLTLRQTLTPDPYLGRMNSIYRTLVWGALPLGNFLGGALASAVGIVETFWIGGLIALLGCVAMWLSPVGRLRQVPVATDQEI
jgi:predicted MFS family arabinose efflux permease